MLVLRRHFETPCGSYMGGNTLQQWRPSNLTVDYDAIILPEDIGRTVDGPFVVVCNVFLELRTCMKTYPRVDTDNNN